MRPPAPQPGASCLRTAARDREDQALLPSRGTIVRSTTQQILSACCMPGPGVKDTATTQREKNPCSWGLGRGQVTVSKMCNTWEGDKCHGQKCSQELGCGAGQGCNVRVRERPP